MARRATRLATQARQEIQSGYENFSEGMERVLGRSPSHDTATEPSTKQAFFAHYSCLEWCRAIRTGGDATSFLREIRSASPMAISLASLGIYDAASLQLRYCLECALAYLYFRDHRRELELAEQDEDIWELTRPTAVIAFLRRLPEFKSPVGLDHLNLAKTLYGDLCRFAHPRSRYRMGLRQNMAAARPDAELAAAFTDYSLKFARCSCALFCLSSHPSYQRASELNQTIMMRPLIPAVRQSVVRAIADCSE